MVRALRDFFNANGFCVLEAENGIKAFDLFCEYANKLDVILLDVMMPGQDGLTTLRAIRNESSLIPVILLTAKGEEYDQLSGFSNGADDYINACSLAKVSSCMLLSDMERLQLGGNIEPLDKSHSWINGKGIAA